jgi:hypothetical protein
MRSNQGLQLSQEAQRILNYLAGHPGGNTTANTDDTHDILLYTGGNTLACGRLYDIKAQNLGAGVYRLTLELANP